MPWSTNDGEVVWTDADGKRTPLSEVETEYIQEVVKHLEETLETKRAWVKVFREELQRRAPTSVGEAFSRWQASQPRLPRSSARAEPKGDSPRLPRKAPEVPTSRFTELDFEDD